MASAVACAALPEIASLTAPVWSPWSTARTPAANAAGPRVMGSLQTADETDAGVDRFRFAAGTPFEDERADQDAASGSTAGADAAKGEAVPERLSPSPVLPEPEAVEARRAIEAIDREARTEHIPLPVPDATPDRREPDTAPVRPGPDLATPPVAVPEPPASPPGRASLPEPKAAAKPAREVDAVSAARGKRPAIEPQQATRRPGATAGETRSRRRSAAADDEGKAPPKVQWRPENLNNWPD